MTIVCCGHPPVVHVPHKGNACFVKLDGDVLGVFPNADFGQTVVNVKKGDRFFLYTDGLVEKPEEGKVWSSSLGGLPDACEKLVNVSIRNAPDGLIELMLSRDASLEDDIVVLAIEV